MSTFHLDDDAYNELLNLLNNQHFVERPGATIDMGFLSDDWWLGDTVVIDHVVKREGMWEIQLVFAHYKEPHKLIKRIITRHVSKKKAEIMAMYMRRLAAKDPRGTLEINVGHFKLCSS